MFYLFLCFHILVFIEAYFLIQKKLRKTGTMLIIINGFMTILNLLALSKTLTVNYSSIVYLESELKLHPISNILWIIINILQMIYLKYVINLTTKRQKQNKAVKYLAYFFMIFIGYYFLLVVIPKLASVFTLLVSILLLVTSFLYFIKTKKNYILIVPICLIFFIGYFYGTSIGSAKLCLILNGYPIEAIETGFEELKYLNEKNITKYSPIESISLKQGQIQIIEVKKVGFIKFSKIN